MYLLCLTSFWSQLEICVIAFNTSDTKGKKNTQLKQIIFIV